MSYRALLKYLVHVLVLASWLESTDARTLSVFSASQFVAALEDTTADKVQVATPLLALTEDVFQGVSTPIHLNRTVSVEGSPELPEPPMILLFARQKIELQPGITFALVHVAIQYYVTDSPARAPNFYIFAPSKAPTLGPNSTRILMQGSVLILAVGLPAELRKQNVLSANRPLWEGPGLQDIEWTVPGPLGALCANDSTAPLLNRCWFPGSDLYRDVAFAGGDISATDGTVVPNNVTIRFINSMLVCRQLVSNECISSLGPYGCLVYTYRQVRAMPPVPISAQMAALLAQQQGLPPGFYNMSAPVVLGGAQQQDSDTGGGSSSSQTAVLVGAIVGGVAGAALLVGAVTAILWSRRRNNAKSQPLGTSYAHQKCAGLDSSESSASLQQLQAQQSSIKAAQAAGQCAEHVISVSLAADADGRGSPETGVKGLVQEPSMLQAHPSDCSSRQLNDAAVMAAPFCKGLATNLMMAATQNTASEVVVPRAAGKDTSSPTSGAIAVPPPTTMECRPDCKAHSLSGGGMSGRTGSTGTAQAADSRTADTTPAGPRQPRPELGDEVPSAAFWGSSGGAAMSAGGTIATLSTDALASRIAVLLLESSSDIEKLLGQGSGVPAPGGSAGAAGDTVQGVATKAVRAKATMQAAPDAAGATGTTAAAVSLGHGSGPCEEPTVQVEVLELLPQNKLGKGSFGRVVEGRYRGQRVAVKQALDLHDGLSMPVAKLVASFIQEVDIMGRCEHPNICKLLAACIAPPKLCLVMEVMDTSLESLLYGGPPGHLLLMPKALHIAIQVAQGLEYLHPTVFHRDLKPANVLISNPDSDTPIVKLTDFGLSKISEMTLKTVNPEAGTPAYMAPECFDITNNKLTHKVDMYAFGVLLWAMLTGEEPWKGFPMVSVAYSVHCGRRLPLSDIPEGRCPRKLRRLIEQCWEPTPRRRPAAAEAVKELFLVREQLLTGGDTAPSSVEAS